jgi:hypothetical protein
MEVLMNRLSLLSFFAFLLICVQPVLAAISVTVNGQSSNAVIVQGDSLQWTISGLPVGATVSNEIWIDLNANGVLDRSTDILLFSFSQTDGVNGATGGNGNPGDMDGSANGVIYFVKMNLGLAPAHYIFRTALGSDTISATFTEAAIPSPTYTISGSVQKLGTGVANVLVSAQGYDNSEWDALTDANGNYTINIKAAAGAQYQVQIQSTSVTNGYTASPGSDQVTLNANLTGINFVLAAGKITGSVRDTVGNPLVNISVNVYPPNGGTNYNGQTDGSGNYAIAVPPGSYRIQFGNSSQSTGYLITYYNQAYVDWMSNNVIVSSSTDTVKNINAVLKKGGVISGTVVNAGSNGWGITAYPYGSNGNPSFSAGFGSGGTYSFVVLPGTYSIQFSMYSQNSNSTQFYYNQISQLPGTAVTVSAVGDTVFGINADFTGPVTSVPGTKSAAPKTFALSQNYPNPFNPSTVIGYQLPMTGSVTLKIYNVLGQEVASLVNGTQSAGSYSVVWNASQFASGVYFYKIQVRQTDGTQTGSFAATKRLVLLK